jgi:tetratricopeptide (TPR) repeat protein
MAPEQAEGNGQEIGPRTDVYALGAILYELLTGERPFKGNSPLETLNKVRQEDPVSPRRLKDKIPRDLETICLKALAKEPTGRYTSALALAHDLECFRCDVSIRARPERITRKTWRKLRRHPVQVLACVMILLAVTVAGLAFLKDRHVRQIEQLSGQLDAALQHLRDPNDPPRDSGIGTEGQLEEIDASLAHLRPLAPEKAADYQQRVHKALVDSIAKQLNKPRLTLSDKEWIDSVLAQLEERAPEQAVSLRQVRDLRFTSWETVISWPELSTDWEKVFRGRGVWQADKALLAHSSTVNGLPVISTNVLCPGDVELEASFDGSWTAAGSVGLMLPNRYDFLLWVSHPFGWGARGVSLESNNEAADQEVLLEIRQNRARLHMEPRRIKPGPVHLIASRKGDRLTFQVNESNPVVFHDLAPLDRESGSLGLVWPQGVRLLLLHARKMPPPAVSPLEQGDTLYVHRRYTDARDSYQKQIVAMGPKAESALWREALCKIGFCHLQLGQPKEAREAFTQAVSAAVKPGEIWAVMARYQLWLLHVQAREFGDAEQLFHQIMVDCPDRKEIASLIPDAVRDQIGQAYFNARGGYPDPKLVHQREVSVEVCDFLQVPERLPARVALARAYWRMGQVELACRIAKEAWQLCEPFPLVPSNTSAQVLLSYSWILRQCGEAQQALGEIDKGLFQCGTIYRALPVIAAGTVGYLALPGDGGAWSSLAALGASRAAHRLEEDYAALPLLLERARVHTALAQWDQAEADLDQLFRIRPVEQVPYSVFCRACLLQGFLRERRGDGPGALQAWRRGLFLSWAPSLDPQKREQNFAELDERVHHVLLASLANQVTEADAPLLLGQAGRFARLFNRFLPTSVLRDMCRGQRGRDAARQYAFMDLSLPIYERLPFTIVLAEFFRQSVPTGDLSKELEELLWVTAEKCVYAGTTGQTDYLQQVQLLTFMQGFGDWPKVSRSLDPSLRGPLAYVLGHRYLHVLKKPKEALGLFGTARDDALPGTPLRRLAQVEWDRLTGH